MHAEEGCELTQQFLRLKASILDCANSRGLDTRGLGTCLSQPSKSVVLHNHAERSEPSTQRTSSGIAVVQKQAGLQSSTFDDELDRLRCQFACARQRMLQNVHVTPSTIVDSSSPSTIVDSSSQHGMLSLSNQYGHGAGLIYLGHFCRQGYERSAVRFLRVIAWVIVLSKILHSLESSREQIG